MKSGYIAITASVIIAAIIMAVVFATNYGGFFNRFNFFNSYFKEASRSLAIACEEYASLQLAQNINYAGNETVTVAGSDTCKVLAIETSGGNKIIKTQGAKVGATTDLKVTINATDFSIVSWEELPNF